jgi:hypothetical protein
MNTVIPILSNVVRYVTNSNVNDIALPQNVHWAGHSDREGILVHMMTAFVLPKTELCYTLIAS